LNNERLSWSSNNAVGAFSSYLKFSMAGYRFWSDGAQGGVGGSGYYWSSSVSSVESAFLSIGDGGVFSYPRSLGNSVRCIKN
jgi:hypothetical protein